jgi:hypothetical protein
MATANKCYKLSAVAGHKVMRKIATSSLFSAALMVNMVHGVEAPKVDVVYEQPDKTNCKLLGEIDAPFFDLLINERLLKLEAGKVITDKSTLSYAAYELKGNTVFLRSISLSDGERPPKQYEDRVVEVSHGSNYYMLNPEVYFCGSNT